MSRATLQGVYEVVNTYFQSERAVDIRKISTILEQPITAANSIGLQTAQRWLGKMELVHWLDKNGYVDGHEREDVVAYQQNVFLPKWQLSIFCPLLFAYIFLFICFIFCLISKQIPGFTDSESYD